jgi:hypothetical protein
MNGAVPAIVEIQNFFASYLYVYRYAHEERNTAKMTAVDFSLAPLVEKPATGDPHFGHTTAEIIKPFPQAGQNLSDLDGCTGIDFP